MNTGGVKSVTHLCNALQECRTLPCYVHFYPKLCFHFQYILYAHLFYSKINLY